MAFSYDASRRSPNYTPRAQAPSVWGRARTFEAIAIHWWGDPNTNPTLDGVVSVLCNPNRGASAHFVASGTGRRVANLVDPNDASWATNNANPFTISIECDPRCRPEDYDVVGELIAQIRNKYGNLPLVPHKQFVATACPGNYDLNRLNQVANTKLVKSGNWGDVINKDDDVSKVELDIARIISWGYGRNGLFGAPNALNGEADADLKGHVGTETNADIRNWYNSPEGQDYVHNRFPTLVSKANSADALTKAVAEKDATLASKDAEIVELKQKLAEATEKPQEPSEPENGTDTPNEGETLLDTLKTWFNGVLEQLSKFKRSK